MFEVGFMESCNCATNKRSECYPYAGVFVVNMRWTAIYNCMEPKGKFPFVNWDTFCPGKMSTKPDGGRGFDFKPPIPQLLGPSHYYTNWGYCLICWGQWNYHWPQSSQNTLACTSGLSEVSGTSRDSNWNLQCWGSGCFARPSSNSVSFFCLLAG